MLAERRTGTVAARIRTSPPARRDLAAVSPDVWLVVAITAVAALLRFATITSQSFWVDEATTVHEVGLSFGQMLHALRVNETTPPFYFALAWVWTSLFGAGELGIRSLSAVAGTALIPVIYLCGREFVSRAAGVVAAALGAVSPFMIWYSQEARAYMLLALLCGLSLLCAARASRTPGARWVAAWAGVSSLAVLTHFFAGFLVAPEGVWLLWRRRERVVVLLGAVVAVVQVAVLPLAIGDTSHPLNWLLQIPRASRINAIPVDFGVSELYKSPGGLASDGLLGAAALTAVVCLILWRGGGSRERRGAALAAAFAAAVILVPIVLAWLGHDYVYNRNFMPAWVPLAVVLGAACTAPRARPAGAVLAATLIAAFVWAGVKIDSDPWVQRPDWRGAAAALGHPRGPRVIVAEDGNDAEQPLSIYLPGTHFSYLGSPTASPAPAISELDVVGVPALAGDLVRTLPAGVRLIAAVPVSVKIEVWRFALQPSWRSSTQVVADRAQALFSLPASSKPSVLVQR